MKVILLLLSVLCINYCATNREIESTARTVSIIVMVLVGLFAMLFYSSQEELISGIAAYYLWWQLLLVPWLMQ